MVLIGIYGIIVGIIQMLNIYLNFNSIIMNILAFSLLLCLIPLIKLRPKYKKSEKRSE